MSGVHAAAASESCCKRDTSDHDWLEGGGDEILLINMMDDAASQWFARLVPSDSTAENMNVLEWSMNNRGRAAGGLHGLGSAVQDYTENQTGWVRRGCRGWRPGGTTARATRPGVAGVGNRVDPGVQSAGKRARGTGFATAQDQLVKGMCVADVKTLEPANHCLETEFLPRVNDTHAVALASADDAHRLLEKERNLAAILSQVETVG